MDARTEEINDCECRIDDANGEMITCGRCNYPRKGKSLERRMTDVFIPWIVKRRGGQCQVLFAFTELDGIVRQLLNEAVKK